MLEVDKNDYDEFFEGLSSGKKGARKLNNLRSQHGIDKVTKLRIEGKTPDKVAEILENN